MGEADGEVGKNLAVIQVGEAVGMKFSLYLEMYY